VISIIVFIDIYAHRLKISVPLCSCHVCLSAVNAFTPFYSELQCDHTISRGQWFLKFAQTESRGSCLQSTRRFDDLFQKLLASGTLPGKAG